MTKSAFSFLIYSILNLFPCAIAAQNIAGIVNKYASATAFDTCTGRLSIQNSSGFEVGQPVLIIQMQGATITTSNNSSFGNISSLNSAGLFEVNEIIAVAPTFLTLKYRLENAYDFSTGKVQAVVCPKIAAATVADTLFPKKWDGTTGGVLFLKARKIDLQKPINASGKGFRGGVSNSPSGNNCYFLTAQDAFSFDSNNWRGSLKGEGVAAFSTGKEAGKGAQANGGGGGNDHNSGGGGGANAKNGGAGGKTDVPETFNCQGDHPGVGGKSIVFTGKPRLFMGGGGGSGHGNNAVGGDGGAGGAIVILVADSLLGNAASIFSNGENGEISAGDGAGGGGAGGSILLFLQKNLANLLVEANGGAGGTSNNSGENRCFGPGGGGSAGRVVGNLPINSTLNGGTAGIVTASSNGCNGSSNGAQSAGAGLFEQLPTLFAVPGSLRQAGPPMIMAQPKSLVVCKNELILFSTAAMGSDLVFEWELKNQNGWQAILAGNTNFSGQKSPVLLVAPTAFPTGGPYEFRCKIRSANGCGHPTEYTEVAKLEIYEQPTVDFTSVSMPNLTVIFSSSSQNLTNQLWDFGDGQNSTQPNPSHQFAAPGSYTITLTGWNNCDTVQITKTISTDAAPIAFFEVADSVFGCGNSVSVAFENHTDIIGGAFAWKFPGGQPSSSILENPTITYSSSGIYAASLIASNAVGKDTFSRTFKVFFQQSPTAIFEVTNVSGYKVSFQNLSQFGDSYQWDFGDGTIFSGFQPPNPHIFPNGGPRIVTLVVQNACGAAIFQYFIDLVYTSSGDVLAEKWGIQIRPNPTDGPLFLDFENAPTEPFLIQLFDATGRFIFEKKEMGKTGELDLSAQPSGLYFLKIRGEKGQILRRVVKN